MLYISTMMTEHAMRHEGVCLCTQCLVQWVLPVQAIGGSGVGKVRIVPVLIKKVSLNLPDGVCDQAISQLNVQFGAGSQM